MEPHIPAAPSFWTATFTDPVATFTLFLVVATVGLWIFTGLMWRATVRLASEAKENASAQADKMERSLAESTKASKAMERQNQISEDTAKRQLRAYLDFADLKWTRDEERDKKD